MVLKLYAKNGYQNKFLLHNIKFTESGKYANLPFYCLCNFNGFDFSHSQSQLLFFFVKLFVFLVATILAYTSVATFVDPVILNELWSFKDTVKNEELYFSTVIPCFRHINIFSRNKQKSSYVSTYSRILVFSQISMRSILRA